SHVSHTHEHHDHKAPTSHGHGTAEDLHRNFEKTDSLESHGHVHGYGQTHGHKSATSHGNGEEEYPHGKNEVK
ncbi:hypothetical protein ATANTOWER_021576, partial [Ataeniobius toweri]|nr:hypothetical protein [Ataeniobius toweri]